MIYFAWNINQWLQNRLLHPFHSVYTTVCATCRNHMTQDLWYVSGETNEWLLDRLIYVGIMFRLTKKRSRAANEFITQAPFRCNVPGQSTDAFRAHVLDASICPVYRGQRVAGVHKTLNYVQGNLLTAHKNKNRHDSVSPMVIFYGNVHVLMLFKQYYVQRDWHRSMS